MHLAFYTTHKMAVSKALVDFVHDGIMSPNGLESSRIDIERRCYPRYYRLLNIYADRGRNKPEKV